MKTLAKTTLIICVICFLEALLGTDPLGAVIAWIGLGLCYLSGCWMGAVCLFDYWSRELDTKGGSHEL